MRPRLFTSSWRNLEKVWLFFWEGRGLPFLCTAKGIAVRSVVPVYGESLRLAVSCCVVCKRHEKSLTRIGVLASKLDGRAQSSRSVYGLSNGRPHDVTTTTDSHEHPSTTASLREYPGIPRGQQFSRPLHVVSLLANEGALGFNVFSWTSYTGRSDAPTSPQLPDGFLAKTSAEVAIPTSETRPLLDVSSGQTPPWRTQKTAMDASSSSCPTSSEASTTDAAITTVSMDAFSGPQVPRTSRWKYVFKLADDRHGHREHPAGCQDLAWQTFALRICFRDDHCEPRIREHLDGCVHFSN